jgi:hypothetical protein
MEVMMRVPIVSLRNPEQSLWLTDDPPHGRRGHPVLVDATGQVCRPSDVRGVVLLKLGMCTRMDLYYAAKAAGYHVECVD